MTVRFPVDWVSGFSGIRKMGKENNKRRFPVIVIGILIPIIYSNLGHFFGVWNSPWAGLILATLYVSAGVYIYEGTFKASLKALFIILLFTPVGVFIDVNIDWFFREFDRNLFPLEIALLWITAPILIFIGMGFRKLLIKIQDIRKNIEKL
jgi:hypothetical protein